MPRIPHELLADVADGVLDLDASIRIEVDGEIHPLRVWLRVLVWMAHSADQGATAFAELDLSPYFVAFADAPHGMVLSDLNGRIQHVNAAFGDMLGKHPDELRGVMGQDISTAEDPTAELLMVHGLLRGERRHYQVRRRFKGPGGEIIPCLVGMSIVRDDNGAPQFFVGSVVDHREHQQLAEPRARNAEAAALQRFARGVAHDFNNTLTVVQTAVGLLRYDSGLTDHESLDAVEQAVALAKGLTGRLNVLSRAGTGPAGICDLVDEVASRAAFLRHLLGQERDLTLVLEDGPLDVRVDPTAMGQVLLNLVVNARQATGPSGQVRIDVERCDNGVLLKVSDDGRGMTEAVRQRAQEPFFTARAGGTGLGLAIVSTVVARGGGRMHIESSPGEGTCFHIRLPLR